MANNQTRAHAQRDGGLTVHSTTTDAPILPIEQVERLHSLLPDKVDWVFEQTALEAQARRSETRRINTMVFVEGLAGQIFAFLSIVISMGAAVYCAMLGQSIVASVIGGATVVGLAAAFISGRKSRK
jgi:uncharacterized membrane protein